MNDKLSICNPVRIQRKRTKGWKMPENTIYVGRGSKYGNPFIVGKSGTAQECVKSFMEMLFPYTHHGKHNTMADFMVSEANLHEAINDLKGKNLACWCKPEDICHADALLEIVNA